MYTTYASEIGEVNPGKMQMSLLGFSTRFGNGLSVYAQSRHEVKGKDKRMIMKKYLNKY